jgi:cytochrome c peroxidase
VQFWDGRAPSLEEQAKGPVVNAIEMGMSSLAEAITRLRKIPEYAGRSTHEEEGPARMMAEGR